MEKKQIKQKELHDAIWKIANDLEINLEGWNFKQYFLGTLFYRFISENLEKYINKSEPDKNFDYSKLPDDQAEHKRKEIVKEKGFFILPSELFCNVVKEEKEENLNLSETLNKVFKNIEESALGYENEKNIKGLFDYFYIRSNKLDKTFKEINKKLLKLFISIRDLNFGDFTDNTIDVFGDAYEYLIEMYATMARKSGGEYYTPQEVSELLAKITTVGKTKVNKVYDPACGSGSLFLKFAKVLGKENIIKGFYGQEINLTTYNLCRINMFLHNISFDKYDIAYGDTLIDPKHWNDEPFEAIVSNPPYSLKWEGDDNPILINDPRFSPAGVLAPKSRADLAFVMHILSWLSVDGVAAIIEFPGVLYRGGAEQKIRKYLIENNYIDTVIQLQSNMFFGTNIATCIIVLKKNKKDNKVLFIDASNEFIKSENKNKLSEENSKKILDAFISRKDVEYFSRLVDKTEIVENEYNLSVFNYIKKEDTREKIDIKKLNKEIDEIVKKQSDLRKSIDEIIAKFEENK